MLPAATAIVSFATVFGVINGVAISLRVRARKSERRLLARLEHNAAPVVVNPAVLIDSAVPATGLMDRIAQRVQQIAHIRSLLERAGETTGPAPLLRLCAVCGTGLGLLFS